MKKEWAVETTLANIVLNYWAAKTKTVIRSDAVREGYIKRILARVKEGYSATELQRCIDFACYDDFYLDHAYHKQPHVIFRNAARVDRLLRSAEQVQKRPIPL